MSIRVMTKTIGLPGASTAQQQAKGLMSELAEVMGLDNVSDAASLLGDFVLSDALEPDPTGPYIPRDSILGIVLGSVALSQNSDDRKSRKAVVSAISKLRKHVSSYRSLRRDAGFTERDAAKVAFLCAPGCDPHAALEASSSLINKFPSTVGRLLDSFVL